MTTLGWAPALPDHWDVVPLNFVATMGTGHTPDRSKPEYWEDCSIPWITLTDASRHGQSLAPLMETHQLISDVGMRNSAAVLHPVGTVVLSRTASVGHSAIMGRPMATTQDFATWTCGPRLDPRYLLLVLRAMRPEWERLAFGSTHRTIYMPDLESLRIPFPPVGEQRRIADFLDAEKAQLDQVEVLQARVRIVIGSRSIAQLDLVMDQLAGTYGTRPFRRSIVHIEQGVSPQCDNVAAESGAWGVLKVSAVKDGKFIGAENKQLPSEFAAEHRYEVRDGDLLITRANTPNLVGAAAVAVSPREKLMLCDKIFRVSTTSALEREFLVMVSLSTRIRSICAEASHGTSASMANLKTEEIKRWPIPCAPVPVQRQVTAELSAARDEAAMLTDAIDRQLALLAERRQALITAAVTGQIDVTTARGVDV